MERCKHATYPATGYFQCKENHFETSVLIHQNLLFTISTLIPSLKKIGKGMPKIESENQFLTSIKGETLYLFAKIYPSAIPGHSVPISTLIASLKKIG